MDDAKKCLVCGNDPCTCPKIENPDVKEETPTETPVETPVETPAE